MATDVFISYSRKDKAFAQRIHRALVDLDRDAWVDWEGIPPTVDWWKEIESGIEKANTFIFIISPDSAASRVCNQEIDYAASLNKRIVPVVCRDTDDVPEKLHHLNWIFLRESDDFDAAFKLLMDALDTDFAWVREHTNLLEKAVDWDNNERRHSQLLRGDELEEAETMQQATGKQPELSRLHHDYIRESRRYEDTLAREARRQRRLTIGVTTALFIMIALTFLAINQANRARIAERDISLFASTAIAASTVSIQQKATAEAASTVAVDQAGFAVDQRNLAVTAQAEAENERSIADLERARAEEQERLAVEARTIAEARELASLAKASIPQGNLLTRSMLLTILSLQQYRNATADEVLRYGLDLLPALVHEYPAEADLTTVSYSPDGRYLAAADKSGMVTLIDTETASVFAQFPHPRSVRDLAFHPSRTWLLTGSLDGMVRIWDFSTGDLVQEMAHEGPVNAVRFTPNGLWATSASEDATVVLWTLTTFRPLKTLFHNGPVNSLVFSSGGTYLLTTSGEQAVIWNVTSGASRHTLSHFDPVTSAAFNPFNSQIATADEKGAVIYWDFNTGERVFQTTHDGSVNALAFSPDGTTLLSGSHDRTIRLWDLSTGKLIEKLELDGPVYDIAFSPDGSYFAAAGEDRTARVWNNTFVEVARMEHDSPISYIAFALDGPSLAAGSRDGVVRIWNYGETGQALLQLDGASEFVDLDYSPDESILATANSGNLLQFWNLDEGTPILAIPHSSPIRDIDFSKDGLYVATGAENGQACVWNAGTGEKISCFQHEGSVLDVDFSPDGSLLITGSRDNNAYIWDISSEDLRHTFFTGGQVGEVALHPDGTKLAVASLDGEAYIFEIESENLLQSLRHPAGVFLVSFTRLTQESGSTTIALVTVSEDNIVRTWNADSGLLISKFINDADILAIEISLDNTLIAIASEDNIARVRDLQSGQEVSRIVHDDVINDLVFSSDGSTLATASADKKVLISLLRPDDLVQRACSRLTRNLSMAEWEQFVGTNTAYALTCTGLPPGIGVVEQFKEQAGDLGLSGQQEEALAVLNYLLEMNPAETFNPAAELDRLMEEALVRQGIEFVQDGRVSEALAIFIRYQDSYPGKQAANYPGFALELCQEGTAGGFYEKSLPACDEAVRLFPESIAPLENRAVVHAFLGSPEAAVRDLEKAIELKQNDPLASDAEIDAFVQAASETITNLQSGLNPIE